MIQLKINNMDHKALLTVPTDYERVILALWTIGLDRDPEKYTLRQLDAEFTYTTEEESQMVRLIDPRSSLMNALCFLSEMVYLHVQALLEKPELCGILRCIGQGSVADAEGWPPHQEGIHLLR